MKEKGFAILPALVISTAVLVMGMGAMYMSEMGFRSVSAEHRWLLMEKSANAGLMQTAGDIANSNFTCGNNRNLSFNGANVEVRTTSAGGACFIWSRVTLGNASVVKVGVVTAGGYSTDHGAVVFRYLNELSVGGSSAIASCNPNCRTSAVVIGNSLNNQPAENVVSTCPNNPSGVIALVDPYVPNAFPLNTDLTNKVFNNINDRAQLLNTLSTTYRVSFNNGIPNGIVGTYREVLNQNGQVMLPPSNNPPQLDVCGAHCSQSIEAIGGSISCYYNSSTFLVFNWQNGRYVAQQWERIGAQNILTGTIASCNHLDFLGYQMRMNSFTGGNNIAAGRIYFYGGVSSAPDYTLNLVARTEAAEEADNVIINNVNLFAQNVFFNNEHLIWNGGILYSGGGGSGEFYFKLGSRNQLGTAINPVLIISDGKITIYGHSNSQINGLVFATSANSSFIIDGYGTFSINGMVVSNSTTDNYINIEGNFSINFNPTIINTLSQRYSFVRPPICSTGIKVKVPFMQAKITVY